MHRRVPQVHGGHRCWRIDRRRRDRAITVPNQARANRSGDAARTAGQPRLEPLRFARTDDLEVGYFGAGPAIGEVVLVLHGFLMTSTATSR
jgi:hypothetical protein